jgi:hypothetical protein
MTQENKADRLVILSKGFGARFEKEFFLRIQEAFAGGYRIAETDLRDDVSMRNYRGRQGRAVMYMEGTEPAPFVPAVVEATAPVTVTPSVKEEVAEEDLSTGVVENDPVKLEIPEVKEKAPKKTTRKSAAKKD